LPRLLHQALNQKSESRVADLLRELATQKKQSNRVLVLFALTLVGCLWYLAAA